MPQILFSSFFPFLPYHQQHQTKMRLRVPSVFKSFSLSTTDDVAATIPVLFPSSDEDPLKSSFYHGSELKPANTTFTHSTSEKINIEADDRMRASAAFISQEKKQLLTDIFGVSGSTKPQVSSELLSLPTAHSPMKSRAMLLKVMGLGGASYEGNVYQSMPHHAHAATMADRLQQGEDFLTAAFQRQRRSTLPARLSKQFMLLAATPVPDWACDRIAEVGKLCEGNDEVSLFEAYQRALEKDPNCELSELVKEIAYQVHCNSSRQKAQPRETFSKHWDTLGAGGVPEIPTEESAVEVEAEHTFAKVDLGFFEPIVEETGNLGAVKDFEYAKVESPEREAAKSPEPEAPMVQASVALSALDVKGSVAPYSVGALQVEPEFEHELDDDINYTSEDESESEELLDEPTDSSAAGGRRVVRAFKAIGRLSSRLKSRASRLRENWREDRNYRRQKKETLKNLKLEEQRLHDIQYERLVGALFSRVRAAAFEQVQKELDQQKGETAVRFQDELQQKERVRQTQHSIFSLRARLRVSQAALEALWKKNAEEIKRNSELRRLRSVAPKTTVPVVAKAPQKLNASPSRPSPAKREATNKVPLAKLPLAKLVSVFPRVSRARSSPSPKSSLSPKSSRSSKSSISPSTTVSSNHCPVHCDYHARVYGCHSKKNLLNRSSKVAGSSKPSSQDALLAARIAVATPAVPILPRKR